MVAIVSFGGTMDNTWIKQNQTARSCRNECKIRQDAMSNVVVCNELNTFIHLWLCWARNWKTKWEMVSTSCTQTAKRHSISSESDAFCICTPLVNTSRVIKIQKKSAQRSKSETKQTTITQHKLRHVSKSFSLDQMEKKAHSSSVTKLNSVRRKSERWKTRKSAQYSLWKSHDCTRYPRCPISVCCQLNFAMFLSFLVFPSATSQRYSPNKIERWENQIAKSKERCIDVMSNVAFPKYLCRMPTGEEKKKVEIGRKLYFRMLNSPSRPTHSSTYIFHGTRRRKKKTYL